MATWRCCPLIDSGNVFVVRAGENYRSGNTVGVFEDEEDAVEAINSLPEFDDGWTTIESDDFHPAGEGNEQ